MFQDHASRGISYGICFKATKRGGLAECAVSCQYNVFDCVPVFHERSARASLFFELRSERLGVKIERFG